MPVAAMLLGIPIVMIFLARAKTRGINRWANIVAAVITSVYGRPVEEKARP